MAEGLHHFLSGEHLLHESVQLAKTLLLTAEVAGRDVAELARGVHHDDRHNDGEQRERPRKHNHRGKGDDDGDHRREDVGQGGNHLPKGVDVVGIDRHDVAVSMLVEIVDGQLLHVAERVAAESEQGSLAHVDHQPALQVGAQGTGREYDGKLANGHRQRCVVGLGGLCQRDDVVVDKRLGEECRRQRGYRCDEGASHDHQDTPLVVFHDHAYEP